MKKNEAQPLKQRFEDAVRRVNSWKEPIAPDTLLRLYAFYKVARSEEPNQQENLPLIDGFKSNALLQVRHLTPEQAMEAYLETVHRELDRS